MRCSKSGEEIVAVQLHADRVADAAEVLEVRAVELAREGAQGSAVASEQAINAPVKLGLALLTDRDGVIEVNLPIQGDMSDPEFSVGQIVMRAFVNLLVKAAASPFSMLGSLAEMAGFSSEELGQVSFVPGSVQLADNEAEKLSALAQALRERPELLLNIRGAVAPEADALALLKAQMQARGETWRACSGQT